MKKLLIALLLVASITSVYASTEFSWSQLSHRRLDNFVRLTKLPPGQYIIGVSASGNTIQQYSEGEPIILEREIVEEVPVEKIVYVDVVKYLQDPRLEDGKAIIVSSMDADYIYRMCSNEERPGWNVQCLGGVLYRYLPFRK